MGSQKLAVWAYLTLLTLPRLKIARSPLTQGSIRLDECAPLHPGALTVL